ncbi:MAG: DinB family protein [Gemmatimonadetes bacterium]|nr:DinB family protein [Gemmatimonadota bacterium]
MRPTRFTLLALFAAAACTPAEKPADTATTAPAATLMADLMKDVGEVEQKLVDLAKAIPANKYSYRPSAGVRSVGEVVMHVASDNYFIPAAAGTPAPAATGIVPDNYESVVAYEKRAVSPDSAVKEMQASFAFMKQAMQAATPEAMSAKKSMFGAEYTGQQVWIMATTHLHEHLGQMIAYARANNITPPWSK